MHTVADQETAKLHYLVLCYMRDDPTKPGISFLSEICNERIAQFKEAKPPTIAHISITFDHE